MSRKKGTPKTGGRTAGTPNKISVGMKDFITKLVYKNRKQIEKDLQELQPKERLLILEKLMQYVIPKHREVEISGELQREPTRQEMEDKALLDSLPSDVIADMANVLFEWENKQRQEQEAAGD